MPFFKNRTEAGQRLAERLASERPAVLLDLLLVRTIGAPWQRELAVAAAAPVSREDAAG